LLMRAARPEASAAKISADFDRIAKLPADPADDTFRYHSWLLARVPPHTREALDLGCGSGDFARLLARRVTRVHAIDLSPQMIAAARARSPHPSNLTFELCDALAWDWPIAFYDCIVSVACLHHLPMDRIIPKIKAALRPGGVLLIIDLRRNATLTDHALRFVAFPTARLRRWFLTGTPFVSRDVRRAWDDHARTDRYLSVPEVRAFAARELSGAEVRRWLYWRYSLFWQKPAD
jgi:SAM-dependent methyltransferase